MPWIGDGRGADVPQQTVLELLREQGEEGWGRRVLCTTVVLLGLVGLGAASEGVRQAFHMMCDKAKCKSGDGEEKPHSCLANAGEPSFPRQARPDSVESSAVHSCIGLKMGSEDSECFDIDRTDSAGKGSFSRRRRKRPSESPEAQSGEHTGKGAVEYDEFDEDVSLDGIDEAELKMRLTKRTLLAAEQHEGEGNDDMEFDRNAGRWMGNESILLDFDEVGASPNRFRASNMRKEATEAASLGAFGIANEEVSCLRREARRSNQELGAWFREGPAPFAPQRRVEKSVM